jgi:hypothetical protein
MVTGKISAVVDAEDNMFKDYVEEKKKYSFNKGKTINDYIISFAQIYLESDTSDILGVRTVTSSSLKWTTKEKK